MNTYITTRRITLKIWTSESLPLKYQTMSFSPNSVLYIAGSSADDRFVHVKLPEIRHLYYMTLADFRSLKRLPDCLKQEEDKS